MRYFTIDQSLPILMESRDHHATVTLHHLIRIARCKPRIAITVYKTWSVAAHDTHMCCGKCYAHTGPQGAEK